jgi:hypothetical protein
MYFEQEDERDPFEVFGEPEAANDEIAVQETEDGTSADPPVVEPEAPQKSNAGFSWAGFAGGLAALVWIAGAVSGPLTYYGVDALLTMDPAMQAGLIALAFGPALLFWVAASAAGEALKARRLASELTRIARETRSPFEASGADAQRLSHTVKEEIDALSDAVAAALDRLAELESVAQRNASLFNDAIAASRDNAEAMTLALRREREAMADLNGDLRGQTETMAHSIGRQIRLMREASKLVKNEVVAAEDALESHLASFTASAAVMGERTAALHQASDTAAAATASLNGAMTNMLDGLSEATRLADAARESGEQAVLAANETASAVRETTRSAVYEAKRAAQLIRAETVAMQDTANETLARLQEAAQAAREASAESQAAADRHAATIEQRLGALAAAAGGRTAARPAAERVVAREPVAEAHVTTLRAAANAAVARTSARPQTRVETDHVRRAFKGFGSWGNFMPQQPRNDTPTPANEDDFELADFRARRPDPDAAMKQDAVDLVISAGVNLDNVLQPEDLDRIARSSRQGAAARRGAVLDIAPGAVGRIARHVKRNGDAHEVARRFRARPDLAKSDNKAECSDLVRAYLLIDAALA